MPLSLEYAALTDVGRVRRNNEDSAYAGPHLLLLADGMGGAAAGEVASATAVEVIRKLDSSHRSSNGDDLLELLAGAVHRANERLSELVERDPDIEGTGSTVTAILFDGEHFALAHLGDSRAYLLRDGVLSQLSHDHTFVQSLVDEGRISLEEAQSHPHRNLILRVLDGRPDSDPDLEILDIRAGDRLMLCSDGIPDYVTDDVIGQSMRDGTPDSVAVDLITIALERGSNDNVTCIVADVVTSGGNTEPQLVGAAAELGQGGTGPERTIEVRRGVGAGGSARAGAASADELEELRYAPQPPKRFRWARRVALLVVLVALVAVGGRVAYGWTQRQYYVGSDGDQVAIFKGIDEAIPGINLSSVYEVQPLQVDQLPTFRREQVEQTISATSLQDARNIVTELRTLAAECAKQHATPRPSTTPSSPTTKPSTPATGSKPPASRPPTTRPATTRPSTPPSSTHTTGTPDSTASPGPDSSECEQ